MGFIARITHLHHLLSRQRICSRIWGHDVTAKTPTRWSML
jgi:hypothetical protein